MRFQIKNVKINAGTLKRSLSAEILKSSNIKKEAFKIAEKRAQDAKDEMLKAFEASPVTREIDAGAENTVNFSKNLLGIGYGEGSLFGFIGFDQSDNPMELVREYLNASGKIFKTPKTIKSAGQIYYQYKVEIPNVKNLEAMTPMPWEGGRSWIRAIERGISGLGYYLLSNSPRSRSTQGVQASRKLRNATYRPTKYISNIVNAYAKYLQTGKKSKLKK